MAKYVDVDELKKRAYPFPCAIGVEYAVSIRQIDETPTAAVVEVVRCKDCRYWNCVSRVTEHMGCSIFCGAYEREYPTNADDFCSYGQRK